MRLQLRKPLLLILSALAAATAHEGIPIPEKADLGDPFIPRPEVAKLSSVGFHTVMSDFYWLRAIQVVGRALHPEHHGTLLGRYVDVVTTVDPWVDHPYRFAALWLTGSEADVRHANRLLRRSFRYHPEEWRNRFYLGFNLFYFLGEEQEAAAALEAAAELEGAPPYIGALAARLRAGHAGLEVAETMIREMWSQTEDPKRRAEYEKILDEIETERRARILDEARERFRQRRGRDLASVEDLVRGSDPELERLPPEPHGWEWVLDPKSGEIVSSYYGDRYRPHVADARTRKFIYGWSIEDDDGASGSERDTP